MPKNKIYTEILLILAFVFVQPLNFFLKVILVPITRKKSPDFWYAVPTLVFLTFYFASGDFV
jgi:hypothetical protein